MPDDDEIEVPDQDTTSVAGKRTEPRCYPVLPVVIHDLDDPSIEGNVQDLSGHGIQIAGIETHVGQKRTFFIEMTGLSEVKPFSFEAECRWVRPAAGDTPIMAGFEILGITEQDFQELDKICSSYALADSHDFGDD